MKKLLGGGLILMTILVVWLAFLLFDSAISLTYSRAQNESLEERCLLLAKLVGPRMAGLSAREISDQVGPEVLVKLEGDQLWVEHLVFRVKNDRVVGIDLKETCE